jgi:hypothetical protein
MPQSKRYAQGLIASRLLLAMVKTLAATMAADGMDDPSLIDVILVCAVFIGQAERRPMTAAKLAAYVGIPRATVVRRLARMAELGMLRQDDRKRWAIPFDSARRLAHLDATSDALTQHLRRAADELSKMDTRNIAKP